MPRKAEIEREIRYLQNILTTFGVAMSFTEVVDLNKKIDNLKKTLGKMGVTA